MDSMHIARPYAEAFFQQAKEAGKLADIHHLLDRLRLVTQDPAFRACLNNPACTEEKQRTLLPSLVPCSEPLQLNLLEVLIRRQRLLLAGDIYIAFQQAMDKHAGQERAHITSAEPLTQAQQKQLIAQLEQTRKTRIYADFHTDPTLIGGYKIQVGDCVENRTVRYQLTLMKNALIQQQDASYGNH